MQFGEQSEKLPEFLIVLSGKWPECSRPLPNQGAAAPLPPRPYAYACTYAQFQNLKAMLNSKNQVCMYLDRAVLAPVVEVVVVPVIPVTVAKVVAVEVLSLHFHIPELAMPAFEIVAVASDIEPNQLHLNGNKFTSWTLHIESNVSFINNAFVEAGEP